MTSEREKSDLPSFGPTILPEPDTSSPPTPIGKFFVDRFRLYLNVDHLTNFINWLN